ncbi:hypothetical protein [Streptomyces sp. NPDC093707]|uniref:hypothetical protein n=1 Tax=Streptomyces sp. NPDC093707 TaxID=3154984 RepID=UPI00344CA06E
MRRSDSARRCGDNTTGADLLSWLAEQLRASAIVRANLPHLGSRQEQVAHLAAL